MNTGMTCVPKQKEVSLAKRIRFAGNAAYAAVLATVYALCAKANTFLAGTETDFLKKGGNKAFDSLNKTAQQTGASGVSLVKTVSIICFVIAAMLVGIGFGVTKNANKRDENKGHLGWLLFGIAFAAGAIGIVNLFYGVGSSIK